MTDWISIEEKKPEYGVPVLIVCNDTVQNITYFLDGDDDDDWFEPYYFEVTDKLKVWWHEMTHWKPLPEPPNA